MGVKRGRNLGPEERIEFTISTQTLIRPNRAIYRNISGIIATFMPDVVFSALGERLPQSFLGAGSSPLK